MIEIEGYLLQKKLEVTLRKIVGEVAWRGRELTVPGSRRRWDMAYEINQQTTVVEFDGDAHYWNSLKIKVDLEKDAVAEKLGYKVVRIPYWVQLTTETLSYYFGLEKTIKQNFPHGFITTKIFPASFSELGVNRFRKELIGLPQATSKAVIESLQLRAEEHGAEYVLPSGLAYLLSLSDMDVLSGRLQKSDIT